MAACGGVAQAASGGIETVVVTAQFASKQTSAAPGTGAHAESKQPALHAAPIAVTVKQKGKVSMTRKGSRAEASDGYRNGSLDDIHGSK